MTDPEVGNGTIGTAEQRQRRREQLAELAYQKAARDAATHGRSIRCGVDALHSPAGCTNDGSTCICQCHDPATPDAERWDLIAAADKPEPDEALAVVEEINEAKRHLFARIVANAHLLDVPFTDAPDHSPWTLLKRDMNRLSAAIARSHAQKGTQQ